MRQCPVPVPSDQVALPAGIVNPSADLLLFSAAKQAIDVRCDGEARGHANCIHAKLLAAPAVKEHSMLRSMLFQGKRGLEAWMSDQNK